MARDGSGNYNLPAGNPVVTNTTITSSWANGTLTDVGTALTQSLSKDGQTAATGNLPIGGFHLTGLGNGTARTDSANIGQIQDEVFVWGGTASGSATAMSIITSPATAAYVAGQVYKFIAVATNTGALTLAVNGLAATAVTQGGSTPLVAGDVLIGQVVEVVFDGTRFQLLNPASVQAGSVFRKNVIINGNFDVWQRGTSLAAVAGNTRYLADRFSTTGIGSTVAPSQQAFTPGQTTVPGEPAYFHRTVVASVAGAGNFAYFSQPVEGVRTFAGQTTTFSFWAKADAAKNIALEFLQAFGTGGAPSASVFPAGAVTTFPLTTAWQKFTVTLAIPSISGKTIGTDLNTSFLQYNFWLDAGSSFNARTNSLGQQSGTFDFAQMQFEAGSVATNFEYQSFGDTLQRCLRYYEKSFLYATAPAQNVGIGTGAHVTAVTIAGAANYCVSAPVKFSVPKRTTPTFTYYNPAAANAFTRNATRGTDATTTATNDPGANGFSINVAGIAGWVVGDDLRIHWTADAEL